MNADVKFFFDHAPYSYGPGQAPGEARTQNAQGLAACEAWAEKHGVYFVWEIDSEIDSSEFSDDPDVYAMWQLTASINGEWMSGLGGVDFGKDGVPDSDPYKRVLEAEMAREILSRSDDTDWPGFAEITA